MAPSTPTPAPPSAPTPFPATRLPTPFPRSYPWPAASSPIPRPTPTPTLAPNYVKLILQKLDSPLEFPLYQVTETAYGIAGSRWFDEQRLEIRIAHWYSPHINLDVNTAVLDLFTGNTLILNDCSFLFLRNHQVDYDDRHSHAVYATCDAIFVVDLNTGSQRRLVAGPGEICGLGGHICYSNLALSPDGRYLAFHDCSAGMYKCAAVRVLDITTSEEVYAYYGEGLIGAPAWSPDGRYLAFYSDFTGAIWGEGIPGALHTVIVDMSSGEEKELPEISSLTGEYGIYLTPEWVRRGKNLLLWTAGQGIWIADLSTFQIEQLPGSKGTWIPAFVSPDEDWVVYGYGEDQKTYVYGLSTGEVITLNLSLLWAVWSPNSDRVFVVGYEYPKPELGGIWVNINTREEGRVSWGDWGFSANASISWSPDGRCLAGIGKAGLWLIDPVEGPQVQVVPGEKTWCESWGYGFEALPHWSPDGRQIAFTGTDCELYLVDVSNYVAAISQGCIPGQHK